jgi:hypothetical protein
VSHVVSTGGGINLFDKQGTAVEEEALLEGIVLVLVLLVEQLSAQPELVVGKSHDRAWQLIKLAI